MGGNNAGIDAVKKNNKIINILIIVIILAIIVIAVSRNIQKREPVVETQNQSEADFNKAIALDTTASINSSLDNINLDDTSDTDLTPVDQELQKL